MLELMKERGRSMSSNTQLKNKITLIRTDGIQALERFANDVDLITLLRCHSERCLSSVLLNFTWYCFFFTKFLHYVWPWWLSWYVGSRHQRSWEAKEDVVRMCEKWYDNMQPGWCQPIRQEFMENKCEALPGVAYPGVRDNRSTLNTKTGYDDMMKWSWPWRFTFWLTKFMVA